MFAETTATLTAIKQAFELLKVIKDARDASLVHEAIGELSQKISELQMLNMEIVSLYHEEKKLTLKLSEEKAVKEAFILQSANYAIYRTETGTTVYRSKTPVDGSDYHHYLCAHCYQNEKISILQPSTKSVTVFNISYISACCPSCSAEFVMHKVPSHEEMRTTVYEFKLS